MILHGFLLEKHEFQNLCNNYQIYQYPNIFTIFFDVGAMSA